MPPSCPRRRRAAAALLSVALAASPTQCLGQAPANATLLQLNASTDALCLDGRPAFVYVSLAPSPSSVWVFSFGASPELAFCVDLASCLAVNASMAAQGAPPASFLLPGWGVQSRDCVDNPDFCNANHILFPMGAFTPGCDLGLMVAQEDVVVNASQALRFRGPQIIAAAVAALAGGGAGPLAGARSVLLTGVTFGGMAAVLAADIVQAALARTLPEPPAFKVLPVDALHPRYYSMVWMAWGNFFADSWLTPALQFLANVTGGQAGQPASAALRACAAGGLQPWECLYLNASLPYVAAPLFLLQQLGGVWDYQCAYEGAAPTNSLMQVECSKSSSTYRHYYECVQYPDLCSAAIVANFSIPLQRVYSGYANASFAGGRGAGSGYFLHSCYLGVYSMSGRGNTSVWNIISVNNVTMREAVSTWWHSGNTSAPLLYHDSYWNASGVPTGEGAGAAAPYHTHDGSDGALARGADLGAPIVPPWTSRYFTNPTCRGFPWY
jgi:hypothetical protein